MFARFELHLQVAMKISIVWSVMPCNLVSMDLSFKRILCLHLQGRRSQGGDSTFFWNIDICILYMASHCRFISDIEVHYGWLPE